MHADINAFLRSSKVLSIRLLKHKHRINRRTIFATMTTSVDLTMKERYRAAMVLSGVGDALGYFCGRWEFCHSGKTIHDEVKQMKGLKNIHIKKPKWIVSDDTVMHLATAEALMKWGRGQDKEELYRLTAEAYKESMKDMADRAPGLTSMSAVHRLRPLIKKGYQIPFNAKGGGCGAAMRAMCIGLRYPRDEDLSELISYSIESGRMTHHHPTGYLGSFAAALFTAYSVQGKPLHEWGVSMLNTLPQCLEYVKSAGHYVKENVENWSYFTEAWEKYLESRKLSDGTSEAVFPSDYGVEERDKFVKSVSFAGWGGASGHDAPMIAYDALLGSGPDWEELCSRGMFHAGDSDSTAVIAACCYGAMYGFADVPEKNHKGVEYRKRLVNAADSLYTLSQTGDRYLTKETAAATIIPPDTTPKSCEDPGPPPQIPVQEFKDLVELVRTESVEYEDELAKNLEHDLAMQTKPMEKIPEDSDSKTSEGNKPDGQPMETS